MVVNKRMEGFCASGPQVENCSVPSRLELRFGKNMVFSVTTSLRMKVSQDEAANNDTNFRTVDQ